jgi:acyl-CoA thioester hydrolase
MQMSVVYETKHQIKFSDLDPYNHVRTAVYSAYYVDHRMDGLREYVGWDLKTLAKLPFMLWVKRMEIDFLRSVIGDQVITITSFVREFCGSEAHIECSMVDEVGKQVSRCLMIVAYIDKNTNRAIDWPADTMALFLENGAD